MNYILLAGPGNNWLPFLFLLILLVGIYFGVDFLVMKFKAWMKGRKAVH